jgi:hypothetical protein
MRGGQYNHSGGPPLPTTKYGRKISKPNHFAPVIKPTGERIVGGMGERRLMRSGVVVHRKKRPAPVNPDYLLVRRPSSPPLRTPLTTVRYVDVSSLSRGTLPSCKPREYHYPFLLRDTNAAPPARHLRRLLSRLAPAVPLARRTRASRQLGPLVALQIV